MNRMTRREFLKLVLVGAATATLSPVLHARARYPTAIRTLTPTPTPDPVTDSWVLMGRTIHAVAIYSEPSTSAARVRTVQRDQALELLEEVRAPFSRHNDLWYRTPEGYVHSAWVLPVRVYPPQPFIEDVGEWGFWGEVSQIYTEAYFRPALNAGRAYRFYGTSTFHVIASYMDDAGTGWYKVYDEFPPTKPTFQWVLARDIRRIPRSELAPITPFVGKKRIEINLATQTLTCYEGDREVFSTRTASGLGENATPTGRHYVLLKQVSRHMSNRPYKEDQEPVPPEDIYDLPGVPWNTFFDLEGRAIHGCYWHNDFGIPRSHGCVNVSSDAARFIYRWTHPVGGFEDDFVQSTSKVGTPIDIVSR